MQGGPLMSQHCTVDTYLCLRAVRTEGAVYRNVALKQYLQNMQTFVSVFGKKPRFFVATIFTIYIYIYIYGLPRWLNGKESTCQCKKHGFNPRLRKKEDPWRRK